MGARYLKAEDEVIIAHYPTAVRSAILDMIPNRTWLQISGHARRMGIHRTSKAWGNSIREGRKVCDGSWSPKDNYLFDKTFPALTHAQLLATFPHRTWLSLQSHAQRRGIHRTSKAIGREIKIGRKNAREEK